MITRLILFNSLLQPPDERLTKRRRLHDNLRRWTVNSSIREVDQAGCYYLNPGQQPASEACLNAVSHHQCVLLSGAWASGKSTRLLWLQKELIKEGYQAV
jgi:hypothetical protein